MPSVEIAPSNCFSFAALTNTYSRIFEIVYPQAIFYALWYHFFLVGYCIRFGNGVISLIAVIAYCEVVSDFSGFTNIAEFHRSNYKYIENIFLYIYISFFIAFKFS